MKIYKFKDLTVEEKHSHFYQIVLQNTIWCAKPDSLNDENEFKFKLDYNPSAYTADLLSQVVTQYRTTNYSPPNLSASSVLKHKKLEEFQVDLLVLAGYRRLLTSTLIEPFRNRIMNIHPL